MFPIHRVKTSVFNYDELPPGYYYEMMLEGHPSQRFWHRKKFLHVRDLLARSAPRDVLDVGCGPGSFLSILGETDPEVRAIGVDIASPQIDYAMRNVASRFPSRNISFRQIQGTELPFAEGSMDAVTSIEVIEHIHPFLASKILAEIRRVLRPNGRLVVTTPNYRSLWPLIELVLERFSPVKYHEQHISKFTPNSFVKFLEACGFEALDVNSIFVVAPFLSPLSERLAEKAHGWENSSKWLIGSLLAVEARPIRI